MDELAVELGKAILAPLVVGIVLYRVTTNSEKKRLRLEAIRDLMAYRGDFASPDFSRALNKISITFHDDKETREKVRNLWEIINDQSKKADQAKRAIVGLIYSLCQKNGFKGMTEYDIDQAFTEKKQTPDSSLSEIPPDAPSPSRKNQKRPKKDVLP